MANGRFPKQTAGQRLNRRTLVVSRSGFRFGCLVFAGVLRCSLVFDTQTKAGERR